MKNDGGFSNGMPDLSRGKLRDRVVESLTEMILESDLKPGDQLPSQQELTEKLGVSRVVLREAVQWLEARGLVEAIHGKGVVIKTPDSASTLRSLHLLLKRNSTTLADLWQVRSFLEPEMAESSAKGKFELDNFKNDMTDANFKRKYDLTRKHFQKVEKGDAILVLHYDYREIKNYIGGGTFSEITLAFYLNKPIYFLNPVPQDLSYTPEIEAMDPIILNGDLNNIKL